jgi:hypothetical protein
MPLSLNVEMICKMMQLRMDIGKAGFSPATCLSDIKDLERIREVIESYEAVTHVPKVEHPGYQADIELTCPEGELDRNPAFKTLFNTIEDAVNTYLESGPRSSPEITVRFNKD